MFDRTQIEKFLKINGVGLDSPHEEIRSVLLSAKWHEEDVETALLVLKEDTQSHKTRVDSLHKVFRKDDALKPETISALLGIDMDISPEDIAARRAGARNRLTASQVMHIAIVSLAFSLLFIFGSMYVSQTGMFHQSQQQIGR